MTKPSVALSVIVPVYNEVVFIREILRRISAVGPAKEVIVVDDGSTDGTRESLKELEQNPSIIASAHDFPTTYKFLYLPGNQGKGAAIRAGVALATGSITLIQDADLEYDPQDYEKLVSPILSGLADVVYGSRFRGETVRIHYFWHTLGNRLLTLFSNIFTDLNLTDMETCYKAFRTDILKSIPLRCNRFGFEPEITAKVAKLKCRIYEVPISYYGRGYEEGKKITWKDGVRAILTILKFWLFDDLYTEKTGLRTLQRMEGAGAYNRWLFEQFKDYLGDRILEVGAGVGNITQFLVHKPFVLATDYSEAYAADLRAKYAHLSNVNVQTLDLTDVSSVRALRSVSGLDTILSINVLEDIEQDQLAIQQMSTLLGSQGRLVLLVPAHPALFSPMDRSLGHVRRYSRKKLSEQLVSAGFRITEIRYVNMLGALGWFLNGPLLCRRTIPSRQIRMFDHFLFLLGVEKRFSPPFGLSLLVIADKSIDGV